MSRLAKTPIIVPKGVEIKVTSGVVQVKGPKGNLSLDLMDGIALKIEGEHIIITADPSKKITSATHGLYRALINNMLIGTSKGFEKKLTLIGVGYRAAVQGQVLDLQLGFSHPKQIPIPKNISVTVDKSTAILITGVDKHAVGQFAAAVRAVKPPEPYKGKGVRYENEFVRKKAGKAAKAKSAG